MYMDVALAGNLGADPIVRTVEVGGQQRKVCNFSDVSGLDDALRKAWRTNTHSSNAKPVASVAMMAIRAFLGLDLCSGGWATSST